MTNSRKDIQPASEWEPNKMGMFTGLPMKAYLDAPGASRSLLARVAKRPSTGRTRDESSDAQHWGTLLNDLVLFGTRDYHVRPDAYENEDGDKKPWNGNATICRNWVKAHADKPVIRSHGEHSAAWLEKAAAKVAADPRFRELLKACPHREVSIFGRHDEYPMLIKGRPDMIGFDGTRVIYADIKTTLDGSTHGFSREMLRYGYHKQFALGRQILARLGYSPFEGYLVIVEKGEEPRVQVRKIVERALDKGDFDLDDEMQVYQRCRLTDTWPDFPDELEPHITGVIDLPEHCYSGDIAEISASTMETAS